MHNPTMCEDTVLARENKRRIEHGEGSLWHREQERLTKGWELGEDKPVNLKTYDLPIAGGTKVTHQRPRTEAPTIMLEETRELFELIELK